jgi:hypothetical protein
MAHQMAMVSSHITADIVEANEFAELAGRFYVYGVPKTVINEKVDFDGAVPEAIFLKNVLKAVQD